MTALGYIRQSRRADLDVALSYDAQLAAIRRMAEADGLDPATVTILADMGRSGAAGKERFRPAYRQALALMDAGAVNTIYALSMTRLARSAGELERVATIARDRGIRLVFDKEGVHDPRDPLRNALFGMMSVFAAFERELAVQRARDNVAIKRARGDRMGRWPYGSRPGEDPAVVLACYHSAGNFMAAARLLTDRGVPSALNRTWTNNAVRKVLERHYPDALPPVTPFGRRPPVRHRLAHLARCSCGTLLTASYNRERGVTVYRCHKALVTTAHPRPTQIREDRLEAIVRDELAHLRIVDRNGEPVDAVMLEDQAGERAALQAERERILDMAQRGMVGMDEAQRRVAEVDERADTLSAAAEIEEVGEIDWTWEPAELNRALLLLFREFRMSPDMTTAEAIWRLPRFRAD